MLSKNGFPNKMQESRIDYIDIFRSFGIILMVMGHVDYGNAFDFYIHAFHIPMFFWISGYLFSHKTKEEMSFHTLLNKKAKSLLLPYAIFGIAHYILYIVINILTHNSFDISPLIHLISINTDGLPICGALWFLTALFFTDIFFFLIDRYIVNRTLKTIIIFIITLIGIYAKILFPFTLPFALGPSFVGIGLYYLGYLFRKHQGKRVITIIMNLSWIPTIIFGVITTILIFLNGYINMREEQYSIVPLFWTNALFSIVVGINFSKLIYRYIQNRFIGNWLISIGKNSIIYVCLNQVVIMLVRQLIGIIVASKYLSSILISIITFIILYAINIIFINTKLKLIIGKK